MLPDKRIVDFIIKHHVLTLATSVLDKPWCANCFYAFLKDDMTLVFTSEKNTHHISDSMKNPEVAGSIVLETMIVGKIQGIQFTGIVEEPRDQMVKKARQAYLKRFPYAVLMDTTLWLLKLKTIKMTDNRLGFGKKLIYTKQ
jgi:hypothetical protein